MAFLRFSRDKRGYEHFYLVEPTTRRGKSRNRILYWFRTPPGVKVGRPPFDEGIRRALEAQNPRVSFDWRKLLDTPIPPPAPDVERWRERRRAERADKQAAALEAAADAAAETSEGEQGIGELAGPERVQPEAAPAPDAAASASPPRRRRRRRGGRRGRPDASPAPAGAPEQASAEAGQAAEPDHD